MPKPFPRLLLFSGAHVRALVPPVANDDSYSVHGPMTIGSVLDNDVPPPGGGLSGFGTIDGPHHGTMEAGSQLGTFFYRPNVAFTGTDSFTYTVCSGSGNCSNQATVTLSVNDQAPVAGNDAYIIHGPLGRLGPLFRNDFDPDGDAFVMHDTPTFPQHGMLETTSEADRPFYRTTVDNFVGYDFFTYNLIESPTLGQVSNTASVSIFVINEGNGENAGAPSCNSKVGCPVNVTNGNMFLQQTDYVLPGAGPGISVTRTYNSITQTPGLFGRGWSSVYDEHLAVPEDHIVSLVLSDGRTVHSGRTSLTTNVFNSISTNFYATTVANSDGTYTVTFKDGTIHRFNSSLKLTAIIDRNNNQTTLGYTGGQLSSITDAFGRVVSITSDVFGRITQLSDATGPIATYAYDGTGNDGGALHSVTYADGSKYTFTHVMVGSLQLLATVTDVMGHVVEHHEYDSSGRATTSERQNGLDKYTLAYAGNETDGVNCKYCVWESFRRRCDEFLPVSRLGKSRL